MFKGFVETYGTLIIAAYGVVQLWLAAIGRFIWRKFIYKPKLNIYAHNYIEVGYGNFGPSLGLICSLVAVDKEMIIENCSIILTCQRDGQQYELKWLARRPLTFQIGQVQSTSLEIVTAFTLGAKQTHRDNIFFADTKIQAELQPILKEIQNQWNRFVLADGALPTALDYSRLLQDFIRREAIVTQESSIKEKCYWEMGEYSIKIKVSTQNPKREFAIEKSFVLTREEVEGMLTNSYVVISELCTRQPAIYYFAYPALR